MPEIPVWAQKEVDPASLRLNSLPIDWKAIKEVGMRANEIRQEPFSAFDFRSLIPERRLWFGVPLVASVVAHHRYPEIPEIPPTEEQIKQYKPWLRTVSNLVGKVNKKWQERFDRSLSSKGMPYVLEQADTIMTRIDNVSQVGSNKPRDRFLREVRRLYVNLATPEEGGFLGLGEVAIEDKISELLYDLDAAKREDYGGERFDARRYPLLTSLIRLANFPPAAWRMDGVLGLENGFEVRALAGAEITAGVGEYLRQRGERNLPEAAPGPKEFSLDIGSISRAIAENNYQGLLERVKKGLPAVLLAVEAAIPENSGHIVERMYEIARDVTILHTQGMSDEKIVAALFAK